MAPPRGVGRCHDLAPGSAAAAIWGRRGSPPRRRGRERGMRDDPMDLEHAPGGSVWREDTLGNAMPVARCDRKTALPDAWWRTRIWRTQGPAQRQLQAWPLHR